MAVLALGGTIVVLASINALLHPDRDAVAFAHARDCSSPGADPANCLLSTTALISEVDVDEPDSFCSALISFSNGSSERLRFNCDDQDLIRKGATLNVKLWRGQIVQYSGGGMVAYQGPSVMTPLLIAGTILGLTMVSTGILGLVLGRGFEGSPN